MQEITVAVVKYPDRMNLMLRYVDPITGKHVTKSAGTTNRRDAEKAAGAWQDALRAGRYQKASRITWAAFRERYEAEKLASLAVGTADNAVSVFNHLERLVNPQYLSALTSAVLSDFQRKLRDEGMKETTLAGHLRHLQAALNWAAKHELIPKSPRIERPQRAKGVKKAMRGRPITLEEFERMLAALPKVCKRGAGEWKRFLHGLWWSGLRIGEALDLSWDDDAAVSVHLGGKFPKLRIWAEGEKAHTDRLLPIAPDFAAFLLETPEANRRGLVFNLRGDGSDRPLNAKTASRVVSAIGEAAKVVVNKADGKFASAHDLRRAFATRWARRVMPATLQLLMRHESIETTLTHYVQQDADDVAADLWAKHSAEGNTSGNTPSDGEAASESAATSEAPISREI